MDKISLQKNQKKPKHKQQSWAIASDVRVWQPLLFISSCAALAKKIVESPLKVHNGIDPRAHETFFPPQERRPNSLKDSVIS